MRKVSHKSYVIATITIFCLIVAGGIFWLKQDEKTSRIGFIADTTTVQPVRLVNSDEIVYVEGLTDAAASQIDSVFRYYEKISEFDAIYEQLTDAKPNGELVAIYDQYAEAVSDWFDPDFDLIGTLDRMTADYDDTGALAWLIEPMRTELTAGVSHFYYEMDEDLGGYRMSLPYFLAGYIYADLISQATKQ